MKLENKVVVITGGEGPLGRTVSRKFLEEGARLAIAWYAENEWEEASQSLGDFKDRFFDMRVDATKEDQVSAFVAKAKQTFSGIDALVHMVGFLYSRKMVWETDIDMLDRCYEVNFKSAFLCSKHVLPSLLEKGTGRIVFFPARLAVEPRPGFAAYSASKSSLITLMTALREELKETKITVNCVMPAVIDTFRTRAIPNAQPEKWVTPVNLANLLCTVCSTDTDLISGSILKAWGDT